ncbi:MAG: dihydrofolate reductase [Fusobacteria bacterium]|nr:dihydrofolate reductase [Fusobacteriota bacterium]
MINIIVAIDENFGIGKENQLLVHIREDLNYFKEKTLGQIVVMGRKTYESLPYKPLKGRANIVLSKSELELSGTKMCKTVEEVLEYYSHEGAGRELFIIGGSSVYEAFLPFSQRLYITHIHKQFEADTFFPRFNSKWQEISCEKNISVENDNLAFDFVVYERDRI